MKKAKAKTGSKMWDGRFAKPSAELMEQFNNSLPFDKALIRVDIEGSLAWAKALEKAGILTAAEAKKIAGGLRAILADYEKGAIRFVNSDEDVHMAVERLLTERIGEAGARLHTGRSRNDQVATDTRLHVKRALAALMDDVTALQAALLKRAEADRTSVVPAYTHLQQAQPILLAHYWLSFFFLLEREKRRLGNALVTCDSCPLGSGAVAGSGFPVDRDLIARELGFAKKTENSIDGVASRDFALETLAAIASLGISFSRYAEDLIIWSSKEFGFVELDDAWSSGSSMMPQKKNPDSLELIRGKSGRFIGNYTRFAVTLKGIGLSYYKDLQEDKEPLFDSLFQAGMVAKVFAQVIGTLSVKADRINGQLDPMLLATDIADYLVRKGLPFRHAHKVVGLLVAHCIAKDRAFADLSIDEYQQFSPLFGPDVAKLFSWKQAIAGRGVAGGTGEKSVARQISLAKKMMGKKL